MVKVARERKIGYSQPIRFGLSALSLGSWRANGNGAFSGMLAGLAAMAWISASTEISFLSYNVVGCLVAVAAGAAVSRVGGDRR